MELKEVLLKRRSIRKFTEEEVSEENIKELLHAAMSGPSACNKRPWDFYVVTNQEILKELQNTTRNSNIKAKLAIIVCGNLSRALPQQLADFWIQDCSAATENILLRATDLGLGALWCGIHPQKRAVSKLAKLLELGPKLIPMNIIYIGHSDEEQEARDQYEEKRIHYIQ